VVPKPFSSSGHHFGMICEAEIVIGAKIQDAGLACRFSRGGRCRCGRCHIDLTILRADDLPFGLIQPG
jgi:hypothetical protein